MQRRSFIDLTTIDMVEQFDVYHIELEGCHQAIKIIAKSTKADEFEKFCIYFKCGSMIMLKVVHSNRVYFVSILWNKKSKGYAFASCSISGSQIKWKWYFFDIWFVQISFGLFSIFFSLHFEVKCPLANCRFDQSVLARLIRNSCDRISIAHHLLPPPLSSSVFCLFVFDSS